MLQLQESHENAVTFGLNGISTWTMAYLHHSYLIKLKLFSITRHQVFPTWYTHSSNYELIYIDKGIEANLFYNYVIGTWQTSNEKI